ncbi:radical SAM protein [Plebeiibacterium marinum]|uniref:Radical SAM protein n=1 Tax=Plebeiibacterium marinum TaxID=2992111 RepID=A0AAE3SKN3_9BACT|nr:radical SAM protein [Plebeiobacterium marinum]MCW3806693.1 radical SAM protein [Plebeiobacterium marinum]
MIIFGPVPSRRLITSLGINNILPPKQCSYSCVYCQVGETSNKSMFRTELYKPQHIYEKVKSHLKKIDLTHRPKYLTIVANGEPTLDINLGTLIRQLQQLGLPVAVITNASLLDKEHTRNDLYNADWVSVKIDSVNEASWKKINRPYIWLNLDAILEGIKIFSNDYKGILNTETMLVEGYNDSISDIQNTAKFISGLKPNKAYISIPTRPPVEKGVKPVSEARIAEAWQIFKNHNINVETLTGFEGTDTGYTGDAQADILTISSVHPLREDTIDELLEKDSADHSVLEQLIQNGKIKKSSFNGFNYYTRTYNT